MYVVLYVDPRNGLRSPGDAVVGPFADREATVQWLKKQGAKEEDALWRKWRLPDGRLLTFEQLEEP